MSGKLGVIGHPIKHSLSPVMHNAAFRKLNLDYEYITFDVRLEELKGKIYELGEELIGINVTIPHKINIIKYLDYLSEEARLIGAVNTVKFSEKTSGYNTDGIGCVRALEEADVRVNGKKILVLGAGGASRAISFQLVKEGGEVWVSDKISEKAEKLVKDVKEKLDKRIHAIDVEEKILKEKMEDIDILINATPIGMTPNVNASPINTKILRKEIAVMDIVYNPMETKLLKDAREIGCKTIDGVGMLVHQGAKSLEIWLDIKPPIEVMRNAVVKALNS